MSIIVTTNLKRKQINEEKLQKLIPDEVQYIHDSSDKCTNFEKAPILPEDLSYTKTKGLPH